MAKSNKCKIPIICIGILTLIGIIVFAMSIKVVPLNHVAIIQNKINKKIDDKKIYKNGRYLIGPTST